MVAADTETWHGRKSGHRSLTLQMHNEKPPLHLSFHLRQILTLDYVEFGDCGGRGGGKSLILFSPFPSGVLLILNTDGFAE